MASRATEIVGRIHRALERMAEHASGDDELWLIENVTLHFAEGADLDRACGLADGWRAHVQRQQQIDAMTRLVAALSTERQPSCRHVARIVHAYARNWPRDHATGRRPLGVHGHVYDYLVAGGSAGTESVRKLAAELRATSGNDIPHKVDAA